MNEISIPAAVIDYGHKFAICGYADDYETIISNVSADGECKNQDGLTCVLKNGYQMCPNMQDGFFAQEKLYFTAETIVHELLHMYGELNGNMEHFETYMCKENVGGDYQAIANKNPSSPFDSVAIEYANICPTAWKNLIDSQQECL